MSEVKKNTKDKTALVPRLRFPDFLDSPGWRLEPLSTFISALDAGVSVNAGDRPAMPTETGVLKTSCVTTGVFEILENKVVLEPEELERVTEPVSGDTIIISRMNTPALVGASAYVEHGAANIFLPDRLWAAKPTADANMRFIAYILGSDRGRAALSELAAGSSGSMKNIAKSAVLELLISAPEPAEQQKIADYLSSLDDLIAAQTQKLDTLKIHKKGLMQQLFPREGETVPRLRFLEFREAGKWSFQPLGKLAKRSTCKNVAGEVARVLTNSAEFGVIDQRDFFDKDITNQGNLEGYYIVEEGDYVYNPRISTTAPVGPVSKNRIGLGVMSPLYTVFRFDNNQNDFYAHYFKSTHWYHYMRQVSSTGARHDRMSVTNDDFMGLPLPVSKPEEQQKIADCLSSLDELIAAQTQKLDTLKIHKKGLMQQLFPVLDEVSA